MAPRSCRRRRSFRGRRAGSGSGDVVSRRKHETVPSRRAGTKNKALSTGAVLRRELVDEVVARCGIRERKNERKRETPLPPMSIATDVRRQPIYLDDGRAKFKTERGESSNSATAARVAIYDSPDWKPRKRGELSSFSAILLRNEEGAVAKGSSRGNERSRGSMGRSIDRASCTLVHYCPTTTTSHGRRLLKIGRCTSK